MSLHYLLGPLLAGQPIHWQTDRAAGLCVAFDTKGDCDLTVAAIDSWDDIRRRLPHGWRPDFIALNLGYTSIPPCLWTTPAPLVGLAPDWNLLWHHYRRALRRCDLVLTDAPGVEALAREGLRHARPANLFGCAPELLDGPRPDGPRDIDVLFVGNLQPAVQGERLAWLGRLARLAGRRKVVIATGIFGADYRALLARVRVAFNRSVRGECNLRAMEAAAAGALLFQEAGNREVADYFRPQHECVFYRDDNLEPLLEHYLDNEGERLAVAEAARRRVRDWSFSALWDRAVGTVEAEWQELMRRAAGRPTPDEEEALLGRTWQAVSCADGGDPELAGDLARALAAKPNAAALHNALGVARSLVGVKPTDLIDHFRRAVAGDPTHLVAALNWVAALIEAVDRTAATNVARQALATLDRLGSLSPAVLDGQPYPSGFDVLRVEWERAAWENAGRPAAEARAKHDLLRGGAHLAGRADRRPGPPPRGGPGPARPARHAGGPRLRPGTRRPQRRGRSAPASGRRRQPLRPAGGARPVPGAGRRRRPRRPTGLRRRPPPPFPRPRRSCPRNRGSPRRRRRPSIIRRPGRRNARRSPWRSFTAASGTRTPPAPSTRSPRRRTRTSSSPCWPTVATAASWRSAPPAAI